MKTKTCAMAGTVLIAWGLKRHYAAARADDLWWILSPMARLVGVMTRTTLRRFSRERDISRATACS